MEIKSLTETSTEELQKKLKSLKSEKLINNVLVGFIIAVFVFSIIKGGFGLGSFMALAVAYFLLRMLIKLMH